MGGNFCVFLLSIIFVLNLNLNFDTVLSIGVDTLSPRVVFTKQGPIQGVLGPQVDSIPADSRYFPINYGFGKNTPHHGIYGASSSRPIVEIFKGIPFASPPTNSLRFEAPASLSRGSRQGQEVFSANVSKPTCPKTFEETEARTDHIRDPYLALKKTMTLDDCLYLDIYAPLNTDKNRGSGLPVLIYANSDTESYSIDNPFDAVSIAGIGNIICVNLHFRVGVLGFISPKFGSQSFSRSNFGLWDLIAALQWVKENIQEFGGDMNNISLMGYDSDAILTGLLALSPLSQAYDGLFHRLILLNGSPFSPTALNLNPLDATSHLARSLNCQLFERSNSELVQCLRKTPIPKLLKTSESIAVKSVLSTNPFNPIIDGTLVKENYYLKNQRKNHQRKKREAQNENLARFDLLVGIKEGAILPRKTGKLSIDWKSIDIDKFVDAIIKIAFSDIEEEVWSKFYGNVKRDVTRALIEEYGSSPPIRELISDFLMVQPIFEFLDEHSMSDRSTFAYVFKDYDPLKLEKNNEVSYIFSNKVYEWKYLNRNSNISNYDLHPFELLINLVANFVRSGDPNLFESNDRSANAENSVGKPWPSYNSNERRYLEMGKEVAFPSEYRKSSVNFWSNIFPQTIAPYLQLKDNHNISLTTFNPNYPPFFGIDRGGKSTTFNPGFDGNDLETPSIAEDFFPINQSSVVIVGLILLCLNCLCFMGLFYQRQRLKRVEVHLRKRYLSDNKEDEIPEGESASFYSPQSQRQEQIEANEGPGTNSNSKKRVKNNAKNRASQRMESDEETDNGFGDFLSPNYDPRTKVNRWMRNSTSLNHEIVLPENNNNNHHLHHQQQMILDPGQINYDGMMHHHPTNTIPFVHNLSYVPVQQVPNYAGHYGPSPPSHFSAGASSIPFVDSRNTSPATMETTTPIHNIIYNNPQSDFVSTYSAPGNGNNNNNNNNNTKSKSDSSSGTPATEKRSSVLVVREFDFDSEERDSEANIKYVPVKKTGTLTRSVGVGLE